MSRTTVVVKTKNVQFLLKLEYLLQHALPNSNHNKIIFLIYF